MSSASGKAQRVSPLLSGDETRYRREDGRGSLTAGRYRTLKDMVNELSDVGGISASLSL